MSDTDRHDEFMQLFLEHRPRVYAYIRSLVFQASDADDVMQETASVLWKKFDQYEKGTHFDRWAMRTAYFQVRNFRQKKAREANRIQFGEPLVELMSEDAIELLDQSEETLAALDLCLRKLPNKDRDLVALRFTPGNNNRKVAAHMGKSESAISRQLTRIYSALMRCINLRLKLEEPVGS